MKTLQVRNDLTQFVDRDEESTEILNDIYNNTSSKIGIIAAPTAIGKSAVAQKVLKSYIGNKMIIRVKTNPQNVGNAPNDWAYFESIFYAIMNICKDKNIEKLTFDYFINNNKSIITNKELLSSLIDDIAKEQSKTSYLFVLLRHLLKKAFHLGIYDTNKIVSSTSQSARRIKSHYIEYVLDKQNVIINIDNIQNIDNTSLEHLQKWINKFKNNSNYYLFEYTISENFTYSNLQKFQNYLSDSDVSSDVFLLEKLGYEFIIEVVGRHTDIPIENRHFTVDLTNYYKNDSTGNIRKAIDYSINYSVENNENLDPTVSNLIQLSSDSKYVISVIILNNGRLSYEKLLDIVAERYISEIKLNDILQELSLHLLISQQHNNIEIKHASITDAWNVSPDFEPYLQASYHDYENYLLNELKSKNDSDSWIYLLQLYSSYNPSKIKGLLKHLNNGMIDNISPQSAWHYMNMLIEKTCDTVMDFKDMYHEIISICFECELYQEGYRCIEILEKHIPLIKDHNLLLNKCMYLSALDQHEKNIELCERFMKKIDNNSRSYLNLCLIVMSSYRSTNNRQKWYAIFQDIENNKIYREYIEYGYFLRLTCMYLPRKKGVKYLRKSVRFFKCHKEYHQAGKTLISYAYALASLKKYNKALRCIKEAEKYLKDKRMGQHMFLVNKASILLSKNKFNDITWDLLDKAELSATVPFDKIAIILNKIIWCIENKNYSSINLLINRAKVLLPKEPDKHIHALINYDIYLYYKKIGDDSNARIYYDKAYQVREWCIPMKEIMEGKKNKRIHEWFNCYLEYWTYDLFRI